MSICLIQGNLIFPELPNLKCRLTYEAWDYRKSLLCSVVRYPDAPTCCGCGVKNTNFASVKKGFFLLIFFFPCRYGIIESNLVENVVSLMGQWHKYHSIRIIRKLSIFKEWQSSFCKGIKAIYRRYSVVWESNSCETLSVWKDWRMEFKYAKSVVKK